MVRDLPELDCHGAQGHVDGVVLCVRFTPGTGTGWTSSALVALDPLTGEYTEEAAVDGQVMAVTDLGVRDGTRVVHLRLDEQEFVAGVADGSIVWQEELPTGEGITECHLMQSHVGCVLRGQSTLTAFSLDDRSKVLDADAIEIGFLVWTPDGWVTLSEAGAIRHRFDGGEEPVMLMTTSFAETHAGMVVDEPFLSNPTPPSEIDAEGEGVVDISLRGGWYLPRSKVDLGMDYAMTLPRSSNSGDVLLFIAVDGVTRLVKAEDGSVVGEIEGSVRLADGIVSTLADDRSIVVPPAGTLGS